MQAHVLGLRLGLAGSSELVETKGQDARGYSTQRQLSFRSQTVIGQSGYGEDSQGEEEGPSLGSLMGAGTASNRYP